jgi:toxin YoeB
MPGPTRRQQELAPPSGARLTACSTQFREDLASWVETDRKTALRVLGLVEAVVRDPFRGVGKPEALKHLGPSLWSRRITQKHRLV